MERPEQKLVRKLLSDLDEAAEAAYEEAREASATGEKAIEQRAMRVYGLLVRAETMARELAVIVYQPTWERPQSADAVARSAETTTG